MRPSRTMFTMSRKGPTARRKPPGLRVWDRRVILRQVPKLRKVKVAKAGK